MKGFFLVWSPTGARPPKYRHPLRAVAQAEAERLARENPTHEFFVLAAVSRSWQPENITERLTHEQGDSDDIPF